MLHMITTFASLFVMLLASTTSPTSVAQRDSTPFMFVTKDVLIPQSTSTEKVVVLKGHAQIEGKIESLYVIDGQATLEPGSIITNEIFVIHGRIEQKEGATIPESGIIALDQKAKSLSSDILNSDLVEWFKTQANKLSSISWFSVLTWPVVFAIKFIFYLLLLIVGLIVLRLAPQLSHSAEASLKQNPWQSLIFGFLALILFAPLCLILTLTIIGIPLVPFFLIAFFVFFAAGIVASGRLIGQLLPISKNHWTTTLIGLLALFTLTQIPLWGGWIFFILAITGLGAMIRSLLVRKTIVITPGGQTYSI